MSADSMWYCPGCELWVGYEKDRCVEGHRRPARPVTYDAVEKPANRVTRTDRLRARLGLL